MRFGRARHIPEATFDLTAMIDVILLLIIFFMLTAQFTTSHLPPVDLPKEKGESAQDGAQASIAIDLGRDGALKLNGRSVEFERLVQLVASDLRRQGSGDMTAGATPSLSAGVDVIVRADRQCAAAHLNRLASALSAVGVKRWKLATASEEGG